MRMASGYRCGQCRWLQSSLRVSPAGAGAWGGSASEGSQAGSIRWAPAPQADGSGADKTATSRLAAGQGSCSCRPRGLVRGRSVPGGPGQAADLPVAQAVEDQGEQPAGGGLNRRISCIHQMYSSRCGRRARSGSRLRSGRD
jgi:hypothetical protein